MSNYKLEEIVEILNIRVDIDNAHNIIHNQNYGELLFNIAERYRFLM